MNQDNRCQKYSMAWNVQCERKDGHKGLCVNAGDAFHGQLPEAAPVHKLESAEEKLDKALRKRVQHFEQRMKELFPKRGSFEGKSLSIEDIENSAIADMRKELMQTVAFSLEMGHVNSSAAELALFESWVASRKE